MCYLVELVLRFEYVIVEIVPSALTRAWDRQWVLGTYPTGCIVSIKIDLRSRAFGRASSSKNVQAVHYGYLNADGSHNN